MRLLIYGTSPLVGSGYATAVRATARGLAARGHQPAVFAWNSRGCPIIDWEGVPIYPGGNTLFGHDVLGPIARKHKADAILAICDPWIMDADSWRHNSADVPLIFWFPCQSDPASPALLRVLECADAAWCYSRWGTEVMRAGGASSCRYVPLGFDPAVYRPMDRAECRARISAPGLGDGGIGDRFLVGCVAANSSTVPATRKAFDQLLFAFRMFLDTVDPDAILYLHTCYTREQGGIDFGPLLKATGLEVNRHVLFPDQTSYTLADYTDDALAMLYNAFDVTVQASMAEGFGLPIIEAQASGSPVITTDYSSMPELLHNGIAVKPAAYLWAPPPVDGLVAVPDPGAIAEALAKLRSTPRLRVARCGEYTWGRVLDEYVMPALVDLIGGSGNGEPGIPRVEPVSALSDHEPIPA